MATHDYVIDNSTGANVRADINNVLQAILTNNSSSSAPSTTAAYMWWADTTTGILKIRNSANNAWVELLQLDGTLTLEDGSASTPALAFRDDLNTGIFSSAADTFNVATGGVERMELGATTIFNEDGADVDFRIEGDTDANLFYVDAGNERIGIRNSSPSNSLDIATGNIKLGGGNGAALTWSNDVSSHYLKFTTALNGLTLNGFGGLAFETNGSNERMRIDSSGNVGISTSTPSNALDVQGGTSNTAIVARSTDAKAQISLVDNSTTGVGSVAVGAEGDALFFTSGSGGAERLRIDSAGNVGIGTASPSSFNADGRNLVVGTGSGGQGISIYSANNNYGNIYFADGTSDGSYNAGGILYNHSSNFMRFDTAAGERMRIDSSGKVHIGLTNGAGQFNIKNQNDSSTNAFEVYNDNGVRNASFSQSSSGDGTMDLLTNASSQTVLLRSNGVSHLSGGNVGIGTSSPDTLLHLAGGSPNIKLHNTGSSASANDVFGALIFQHSDSDDAGITAKIQCVAEDNAGNSYLAFHNGDGGNADERMRIHSGGQISIGHTTLNTTSNGILLVPNGTSGFYSGGTHTLHIGRGSNDGDTIKFNRSGTDVGSISVTTSSTAYNTSSDYRLKENVVAISDGITRLKTLKPSRFNFIADAETTVDGFLAHEVTAVPEAITGEKDALDKNGNIKAQSLDYAKLTPLLTAALQEAIAKIEVLETKVATLEAA